MRPREIVGGLTGAVGRMIVDHHDAYVRMPQQLVDQCRQVFALVVRGDDDERLRRGHERPSKRSIEICSDTNPTSRITTLSRMSSTEELVT